MVSACGFCGADDVLPFFLFTQDVPRHFIKSGEDLAKSQRPWQL